MSGDARYTLTTTLGFILCLTGAVVLWVLQPADGSSDPSAHPEVPAGAFLDAAPIDAAPIDAAPVDAPPVVASTPAAPEAPGVADSTPSADPTEDTERDVDGTETVRLVLPDDPIPEPATSSSAVSEDSGSAAGPVQYQDVTFGLLSSFDYEVEGPQEAGSSATREKLIPEEVRALDEKPIRIEGYMIPYKFDGKKVTVFYLLPNTMACCFGRIPLINEVIEVVMPDGEGIPNYTDQRMMVEGILEVGELMDEYGYVFGLYRIRAASAKLKR